MSFGLTLLASLLVIGTTLLAISSGSSEDRDRDRDDSDRSSSSSSSLTDPSSLFSDDSVNTIFYNRPTYIDDTNYYTSSHEMGKARQMGFLESIYSFVFGKQMHLAVSCNI